MTNPINGSLKFRQEQETFLYMADHKILPKPGMISFSWPIPYLKHFGRAASLNNLFQI